MENKEIENAIAVILCTVMANIATICAEIAVGEKLKGFVTDDAKKQEWEETLAEAKRIKTDAIHRLAELMQDSLQFKIERKNEQRPIQESSSDTGEGLQT